MRRCLAFALPLLALMASGAARAEPAYEALNRSLTERVAVPAYTRMAQSMAGLETATVAFSAAPDAADLTPAMCRATSGGGSRRT